MSRIINWLQLFADGGAPAGDGDGAAQGVEAGSPVQTLEDLGVPHDKAVKHSKMQRNAPVKQSVEGSSGQTEATATMSWDDFFAIPENKERLNKQTSDIIRERLSKQGKKQQDFMDKLSPALELIASKYGIAAGEDGSFDPEAIAKAVVDDDSYYENVALDLGVDLDTAKKIDQLERENSRQKAQEEFRKKQEQEQAAKAEREAQLQANFMRMQQETDVLRQTVPDFSLEQAIQDQRFLRLTSPDMGDARLSVEEAFRALYGGQYTQKAVTSAVRNARAEIANSIQARSRTHPRENGGSATAPAANRPNLQGMSHEDRLALIKQLYPPK